MFTPEERDRLRSDLLKDGSHDPRITGVAITGSAAVGREDRWSDIDLAFGVGDSAEMPTVISEWTTLMYRDHLAVHHLDVLSGSWVYRVFLLQNTLQVDLAFAPSQDFRALAPTFRLIYGSAAESHYAPSPLPGGLIGLGWLYALHARSCIARQRSWQAEYMISGIRDNALALACLRHDLPTAHGRGMDQLPNGVAAQFEGSLVRQLSIDELSRAFRAAIHCLLMEIRNADGELGERLEGVLTSLADTLS